jgi:hypothetical protein
MAAPLPSWGSVSSTDLILRPAEGPPLLHVFNRSRGIPAWHIATERDLRDLPHWHAAERIAMAMFRFAEAGEGAAEHAGRPGLYRLRVSGAVALFTVDTVAREIRVWRVLRA